MLDDEESEHLSHPAVCVAGGKLEDSEMGAACVFEV